MIDRANIPSGKPISESTFGKNEWSVVPNTFQNDSKAFTATANIISFAICKAMIPKVTNLWRREHCVQCLITPVCDKKNKHRCYFRKKYHDLSNDGQPKNLAINNIYDLNATQQSSVDAKFTHIRKKEMIVEFLLLLLENNSSVVEETLTFKE